MDRTGVGAAVADLFQVRGLSPIGVTITAGDVVTQEGLNYHVPKLNLVSRLQALLHNGQLKIHKGLADAGALVEELQAFRAQVTDSGYWRFGARSGKHDDLVLAVTVAAWRSAGDTCFPGWGCFEYYRAQFGPGAVDRELTAMPAPLPPLPPEEPDFGYSVAPKAQLVTVMLKAPAHTSGATGMSGRAYLPDRNGNYRVTLEDSRPFIAAGWLQQTT